MDTERVRPGEELDTAALQRYLEGKLPGAEKGIELEQFPKGHSNLTYLLRASGKEYVLRRGPLGPVPPKAHDMAREYRVLAAVHPYFPEAPNVVLLCEDPSVAGAVFFLMERRNGIVLRDLVPPEIARQSGYPMEISEAFVRCLVRLHAIDIEATGLAALGKTEGFLQRQVQGWADRWRRAQLDDASPMDEVIPWLEMHMPASGKPTLVHNDYKLDNVMLPLDSVNRIEAVLDWEMTTVGDPMADLGLTLCYWTWAARLGDQVAPSITNQPGWYGREQLIERYAELSGRDVRNIGYHEVLGVFKLAVILQQIYFRYRKGQTSDSRFASFGERVQALAETALHLAQTS